METYAPPPDGRIGDFLIVSNNVPSGAMPTTAGPADTAFLVGTLNVEAFRTAGRLHHRDQDWRSLGAFRLPLV